jgi:hypothetical protein
MNRKLWISMVTGVVLIILAIDAGSGLIERGSANQEQGAGGGWEYLIVQGGTVNLSGSDGERCVKSLGVQPRIVSVGEESGQAWC